MTPEKIAEIMELVRAYAEYCDREQIRESRKEYEQADRAGEMACQIYNKIEAALTAESDSPEIRKTLDRYMHLAADPYRDNEEQVWLERAYTELRRSNMLPDFLPVDRKPIPERQASVTAESEGG